MHILFALLASLALLIPGTGVVASGMLDRNDAPSSQSLGAPDLEEDFDDRLDLDFDFGDRGGFDEFDEFDFHGHDFDLDFDDGWNRDRQNLNAQGQDGTQQNQDSTDTQQNQNGTDAQQNQDTQSQDNQNSNGTDTQQNQGGKGNRPTRPSQQNDTQQNQNGNGNPLPDQSQGSDAAYRI